MKSINGIAAFSSTEECYTIYNKLRKEDPDALADYIKENKQVYVDLDGDGLFEEDKDQELFDIVDLGFQDHLVMDYISGGDVNSNDSTTSNVLVLGTQDHDDINIHGLNNAIVFTGDGDDSVFCGNGTNLIQVDGADKNGDDKLSFSEAAASIIGYGDKYSFNFLDSDNSGFLDSSEIAAFDKAKSDAYEDGFVTKEENNAIFGQNYIKEKKWFNQLDKQDGTIDNKVDANTYREAVKQLTVSDGKIGIFGQGDLGDCWFLAGLKAVSQDEDGREIIKNSITYNESTGNYTVKFKEAPGKTYTVTPDELAEFTGANDDTGANGDIDVRILEVAANKWRIETKNTDLVQGHADEVFKLITGDSGDEFKLYTLKEGYTEATATSYDDTIKIDKDALKAYFQKIVDTDKDGLTLYTDSGYKKEMEDDIEDKELKFFLSSNHAYAITNIDMENKTLTLADPWGLTETLDFDTYLKYFTSITHTEPEK